MMNNSSMCSPCLLHDSQRWVEQLVDSRPSMANAANQVQGIPTAMPGSSAFKKSGSSDGLLKLHVDMSVSSCLCCCADRDFTVQVGGYHERKPDHFKDGLFTVAAMLANFKTKTAAKSVYILTNDTNPASSSSSLRQVGWPHV